MRQSQLQKKMDESLPLLQDMFFCDLMDGKEIGDIPKKAEYLGIVLPENKRSICICIEWEDKPDGHLSAVAVMDIFRAELEKRYAAHCMIREKTRVACLLFIDEPGDALKEELETLFGSLCAAAKAKYALDLSVGVGIAAYNYGEIYDSYHQSCDILRKGRFSGGGPLFFYSDIHPLYNPTKTKSVALLSSAKAEITDCIYCGDEGKMKEILHGELERVLSGRAMTDSAVILLKIELATFLIELSDKLSAEEDGGEKEKDILKELFEQDSIASAEKKTQELLCEMSETLGKNRKKRTAKIVEAVRDEIRKNLKNGINVQIIAYHIGISPNYLSTVFKTETGVRLTEYIAGVRMEKAAELLVSTGMKVGEIAEAVGFVDQSYFAKTFKKQYGESPMEYRNKKLKS